MQASSYSGPFSFFRKHFNGDYSLGRSYWVNTFLIALVAPIAGLLLVPVLSDHFAARYASLAFLLITVFGLIAWCWAVSGTWASATKHVGRGGRQGWASATKVIIVLGALRTFTDLAGASDQLAEHAKVAAGFQIGPETTYEIRADGKSLLLKGGINDGSADRLVDALKIAPAVTTVVLHSGGGWVRQGRLLAEVIRQRGLKTYVEDECTSACTLAFLAGRERSIDPAARLGFHSFRAIGASDGTSTRTELEALYRAAGLSNAFVQRVGDTPYEKVWFPTIDELLAGGVVTRTSRGGETASIATTLPTRESLQAEFLKFPLFSALSKRYPADFEAVMERAFLAVEARKDDHAIRAGVFEEVVKATKKLIPLASDAVLLELNETVKAEAEALSIRYPEACVQLAFGGTTIDIAPLLPKVLAEREIAALTEVVRTSNAKNKGGPMNEDVRDALAQALSALPESERVVIASGTANAFPPAQACRAGIAFYEVLTTLPKDIRAKAVRAVYAAL
jgi:hypothetical protein